MGFSEIRQLLTGVENPIQRRGLHGTYPTCSAESQFESTILVGKYTYSYIRTDPRSSAGSGAQRPRRGILPTDPACLKLQEKMLLTSKKSLQSRRWSLRFAGVVPFGGPGDVFQVSLERRYTN